MDLTEIEAFTIANGEGHAFAHVRRLKKLVEQIDAGLVYDRRALEFAIYLHDWGAFAIYRRPGEEYALRSRQIVESEVLPIAGLPDSILPVVLEAIELHDYRDLRPPVSPEALLLREADMLDFLGAVGLAREFAGGPHNLRLCYERAAERLAVIRDRFTLPAVQLIAVQRMDEMERGLARLSEECFGYL